MAHAAQHTSVRQQDARLVGGTPPSPPREKLIKGKSIIARVAVVNGASRLFMDREVDLGRGMIVLSDRGSYPCR